MLEAMNKVSKPMPIWPLKKETSYQLPTKTPSAQEDQPGEFCLQLKRRKKPKTDPKTSHSSEDIKTKLKENLINTATKLYHSLILNYSQKLPTLKPKSSITKWKVTISDTSLNSPVVKKTKKLVTMPKMPTNLPPT